MSRPVREAYVEEPAVSKIGTLPLVLAIGILVIVLVFTTCTYVIDEREQAVVTRLSKPIRVIVGEEDPERFEIIRQEILKVTQRADMAGDVNLDTGDELEVSQGAGLRFKLPFRIDVVEYFPDIIIEYDAEPREIVLSDKKKLEVDNFARWRIINPLLYRVRVQNERNARERLDDIIYSVMREELGKNPLIEVIRTTNRYSEALAREADAEDLPEGEDIEISVLQDDQNPMREDIKRGREVLMQTVTRKSDAMAREKYVIQIIDVRIKRADLLKENLQAVFGRMQAERKRISDAYRSEGEKESDIIRGETDRQVKVITANAERDAKILHGEGDAEAMSMISEAFSSNAELYRFMRSLEVLEQATPAGSELIIGLDSGLFQLLQIDSINEP